MNEWEVRTRPWRDRAGLDSDTDVSVTATNRARGWVLRIERMPIDALATFDPAERWAR